MPRTNFHILRSGYTDYANPCHDDQGKFCSTGGESGSKNLYNERSPTESLEHYQNNGYREMNAYLRNDPYEKNIIDNIKADEKLHNQVKHDIKQVDSLFSNARASEVNVHRADGAALSAHIFERTGVTSEMGQVKLGKAEHLYDHPAPNGQAGPRGWESYFNSKMAGQVFKDDAYVSTSTSQKVVQDKFLNPREISGYGGQGLVSITGKAKSLDVDKLTGMKSGEKERLLNRGLSYRINRVELKSASRGFYFHYHVGVVS